MADPGEERTALRHAGRLGGMAPVGGSGGEGGGIPEPDLVPARRDTRVRGAFRLRQSVGRPDLQGHGILRHEVGRRSSPTRATQPGLAFAVRQLRRERQLSGGPRHHHPERSRGAHRVRVFQRRGRAHQQPCRSQPDRRPVRRAAKLGAAGDHLQPRHSGQERHPAHWRQQHPSRDVGPAGLLRRDPVRPKLFADAGFHHLSPAHTGRPVGGAKHGGPVRERRASADVPGADARRGSSCATFSDARP